VRSFPGKKPVDLIYNIEAFVEIESERHAFTLFHQSEDQEHTIFFSPPGTICETFREHT
jgi:hypothetical protein